MVQKYGEQAANEIIQYSYENSTDPTKEVIPPFMPPPPNDYKNIKLDIIYIISNYCEPI